MDQQFLRTFWHIGDDNEKGKIDSICELIQTLQTTQNVEHLDYTLNTLLKGLASSRKFARLGFASALTQVLRFFPHVDIADFLQKIEENLNVEKCQSKSERSNVPLGRLLAYMSIVQSGKILKTEKKVIGTVAEEILNIREAKVPLHEICSEGLISLVSLVSQEDFDSEIWPLLEKPLSIGWDECTPDTLWLLLSIRKLFSSKVDKSFLSKHWKCKQIISSKNNSSFSSVIIKTSSNHLIIHPVCMELLKKAAQKTDYYGTFWTDVLYSKVFTNDSNCMSLVFKLVPEGLQLASSTDDIYAIMSPMLVTALVKNLSIKKQSLHLAAKHLVQEILNTSKSLKSELQVALVMSMVTPPGTVLFDSITNTKTVVGLVSNSSTEARKKMSDLLKKVLQGELLFRPNVAKNPSSDDSEDETTPDLTAQQHWAAHILSLIINHRSDDTDIALSNHLLEFLFFKSFFTIQKSSEDLDKPVELDLSLRNVLRTALVRAMDHVSKALGRSAKGYANFHDILHQLLNYAQSLMDNVSLKMVKEFDKTTKKSWQQMLKTVKKIKKKRDKKMTAGNDDIAFELLFLHLGLQLFMDEKSAVDILEELHTCYEKAKSQAEESNENEPKWVDVVVDLLMSLLSQQSHLVRTIVIKAFEMLCPHMTSETAGLIVDVLKPDRGSGETPLDFKEEDEGESESEDDDAEEIEKDEGIESEMDTEESKSESENESSSDDSNSDPEADNCEVDPKVRESVKVALGRAVADDDDEESEDMDDEAMMKLDKTLAEVFKQMRVSKSQDADKKMQLTRYKMRCLDIVEVMISNNSNAKILLDLIEPLLNLMKSATRDKTLGDLGQRAGKIFNQLMKVKKVEQEDLDLDKLPDMVAFLIKYSMKTTGVPLIKNTAFAVAFIIQIINNVLKTNAQKEKKEILDKIFLMIESQMIDFCVKRDNHMSHNFFIALLERDPVFFWPLAKTILEQISSPDVRLFCQTQATAMLRALLCKPLVVTLNQAEWVAFAEKVISIVYTVLDKKKMISKPRYLHELLLLLYKVCSLLDKDALNKLVTSDMLKTVVSLKASANSDIRGAINKICGCFVHKKTPKKRKRVTGEANAVSYDKLEQAANVTSPRKKKKTDVTGETVKFNGFDRSPDEDLDSENVEKKSKKKRRKSAEHVVESSDLQTKKKKKRKSTSDV